MKLILSLNIDRNLSNSLLEQKNIVAERHQCKPQEVASSADTPAVHQQLLAGDQPCPGVTHGGQQRLTDSEFQHGQMHSSEAAHNGQRQAEQVTSHVSPYQPPPLPPRLGGRNPPVGDENPPQASGEYMRRSSIRLYL